jgi:hypothetical protein
MASGATSKYGLPFPFGSDPNNPPDDIEALAAALDGLMATAVPLATLPTPGKFGKIVRRIGDGTYWIDNGSGFDLLPLLDTHSTDISASAPGDTASAGAKGFAADAGHRHARESAPGAWIALPFSSGFHDAVAQSACYPAAYRVTGTRVDIRGSVSPTFGSFSAGTANIVNVATLPSGASPASEVSLPVTSSSTAGQPGSRVDILTTGVVRFVGTASQPWIGLDGIRFETV